MTVISEESVSAKQKLHDCCADTANNGGKRFKTENEIKQAIEAKEAAKVLVEQKLQALIVTKEKYAFFKMMFE